MFQKFESLKSFSLAVMSIFLDKHHSALWVGTSGGHVIVYSERSYEVLIVMHRHSGPVEHIFVLPGKYFCFRVRGSVQLCSAVCVHPASSALKE